MVSLAPSLHVIHVHVLHVLESELFLPVNQSYFHAHETFVGRQKVCIKICTLSFQMNCLIKIDISPDLLLFLNDHH